MPTSAPQLSLADFLQRPETKPASEYIQGRSIPKPMPQGEYSRLQAKLSTAINQIAEPDQLAYAFPELRCTFGGNSLVPDIAVFRWARIPRLASGRIANRFELAPDWAIEILSPGQSHTKVLSNLLHCSTHGTELGWLLDPTEDTVLAIAADQRLQLLTGDANLPVLPELILPLTANQLFSWLQL